MNKAKMITMWHVPLKGDTNDDQLSEASNILDMLRMFCRLDLPTGRIESGWIMDGKLKIRLEVDYE